MKHPAVLTLSRRSVLLGAVLLPACFAEAGEAPRADFEAVEKRICGRIGVAALDTGNGKRMGHRTDERFAMCSTFKWVLGAAVLKRVDQGQLDLQQRIPYGEADILPVSPVTKAHVSKGSLSVEALCRATIEVSDNAAANLLLRLVSNPEGLTAFIRTAGDAITRLDRTEPGLNTNLPGDVRDTTTPTAMVDLLRAVLVGDVLMPRARDKLQDWMKSSETGGARLRAGLPQEWLVGDKTGAGTNEAVNDVAVVWPPGRAPVIVAVYMSGSENPVSVLEAAHADIARRIARSLS